MGVGEGVAGVVMDSAAWELLLARWPFELLLPSVLWDFKRLSSRLIGEMLGLEPAELRQMHRL